MAHKDYWGWTARKIRLNDRRRNPNFYFYEREVWWTAIGHNVGDEEDGKGYNFARPVLVVRKFNRNLFYGLPLSTTIKQGRYYYPLTIKGQRRTALLSHLRDYDAKRLLEQLDVISEAEYLQLVLAMILLLRPPDAL